MQTLLVGAVLARATERSAAGFLLQALRPYGEALVLGLQLAEFGRGLRIVETDKELPALHRLPVTDEDVLDNRGLGRLDDRLLGVPISGELATELVHIGLAAMLSGAGADVFNRASFNYPTLGDLYKLATYDMLLQRYRRERERVT